MPATTDNRAFGAGRFLVTETTTADDVAAAGLPDPLYCKRGLADRARLLADAIDAERGGETVH